MTQKAPGAATKPRGVLGRWPALAAALVVALLAAGGYAWHAGYAPRLLGASVADDKLTTAPRLSIVVLPFENLSGDKEQDYFADGITDDLTTDLSHLPDSFVISRGTAFTYKGKPVDTKADRARTRRALRAGRQRAPRRRDDHGQRPAHLDRDRRACVGRPVRRRRSRLGELQVEVVSRLANSLGVELVKAEALRAARERPNNPDAVDLAMRGWASLNSGFAETNFDAAIADFERALQLDPELTRAQLGLAWGLVDRAFSFRGGHATVDLPRAEALLTNALAKEPNNAWAHFVKADLLAYGKKQFDGALSELDVAIENDSNLARAYDLRAAALLFSGEAKKAIPEDETALRLSPRDPFRNRWEFRICHAHTHMAEWETAVEWCQKSTATNAGILASLH